MNTNKADFLSKTASSTNQFESDYQASGVEKRFHQFGVSPAAGSSTPKIQEEPLNWQKNNRTTTVAITNSDNQRITHFTQPGSMAGWSHEMYESSVNIRNEEETPDVSSLSISEENNSGVGSSEKAIKLHDNASEATALSYT